MIDIEVALEELKLIVNRNIHDYIIPEQQGNVIRVGYMIIRYSANVGYLIFDTKKQQQVAKYYSKYAALAFSKNYMLGKDVSAISFLDTSIEKNENDIIFYKHTIEKTDNENRKCIAKDRMHNCEIIAESAKQRLESLLFDK
jgi:hypothetical protein